MIILRLLVVILLFIGTQCADIDEFLTWSQVETIFPNHLAKVLHSVSVLDEVQKFSQSSLTNQDGLSIGCIDYEGGQDLAFRARADGISLLPILVSAKEDIICFFRVESSFVDSVEELNYVTPLLQPLKLHSSVQHALNVLSNTDSDEDLIREGYANDLIIYYRPEYFGETIEFTSNLTVNGVLTPSEFYFMERIAAVQDINYHDLQELFKRFFWTAISTKEFFLNADENTQNSEGFKEDEVTFKTWQMLQMNIEQIYNMNEKNICPFGNIFVQYQSGKIIMNLLPIIELDKIDDVAACLAILVAVFADEASVNHIAIESKIHLLNFRARSIQQSSTVGSDLSESPYTARGLRGDDEIITIADTGVDRSVCYFSDPNGMIEPSNLNKPSYDLSYRKIVQYNFNGCGDDGDEYAGHGTHVSGTAVGSIEGVSITSEKGKYDGVAPNGKLSFVDLGKPGTGLCIPNPQALYGPGYDAGARVNSNSWGNLFNGNGYYASEDVDKYLLGHTDSVILFAAGNSGSLGSGSVTVQASGKNSMAVGSSESTLGGPDIDNVAFYSSIGPTYDNRVKPDVVAPGDSLMSALSNGNDGPSCGTITKTGTSMATPAASGIALLVRQYFLDKNGKFWTSVCTSRYAQCKPFNPSGVLVKGILIHSTTAMDLYHGGGSNDVKLGNPPDEYQGFGRITLENVLPLQDVYNFDLFVEDNMNINENSQISYPVKVKSSKHPLTVTLVWYDPPNVAGTTTKALIHDLDLTLVAPNGKKYFGNGGNSPDAVNCNERIHITAPASGVWKITVSAKALPKSGDQLYSLVVTSLGKVLV